MKPVSSMCVILPLSGVMCFAQPAQPVHSAHYNNYDYLLFDLGMTCVKLDLSSGNNSFDLSALNDSSSAFCFHLPPQVKQELHSLLDTQNIFIPTFPIKIAGMGVGKARLNHLAKRDMTFDWSKKYGGSIRVVMSFESDGAEILGTLAGRPLHGQINNAVLSLFMSPQVTDDIDLHVSLSVEFKANVSIDGINNNLVPRSSIVNSIADAARANLAPASAGIARGILIALIRNSPQGNPAPSSDQLFFTHIQISDTSGDVSWLNPPVTFRFADVSIEQADPLYADSEERLSLLLRGGWSDGPSTDIRRVAPQGSSLTLPLKLAHILLPGGLPLAVTIQLNQINFINNLPKGVKTLGTVTASFAPPGYGGGVHQGSNGGMSVTYRVTLEP
jgi:hypothetical protein